MSTPDASLGPHIVLVPGLGLDARAWAPVVELLPGRPRVVTLPSLGERSARGADLQVEVQAGRLIDQLEPGPTVLVGHSAGGAVAVAAALRSSEVVGLVLVGPGTDPRASTWPRMLSQWVRTAPHERVRDARVLAPQYASTGLTSMLRGMDATRRFRTDLAIAQLGRPVVVVRGGLDRIAPQDWCQRFADLSGGRLDTVPGAAHMVPLTHPGSVAAAVREVTARVTPGLSPAP